MKSKLLLCAVLLAMAGCASNPQSPYAGYGNFGFESDLVPSPVQGLTAADVDTLYASPEVSPSKGARQNN